MRIRWPVVQVSGSSFPFDEGELGGHVLKRSSQQQRDPDRPETSGGGQSQISSFYGPVMNKQSAAGAAWLSSNSPHLPHDLKDHEIPTVENRDDDQKHQEEEADEKDEGLDGHGCRHNTETSCFFTGYSQLHTLLIQFCVYHHNKTCENMFKSTKEWLTHIPHNDSDDLPNK